MKKGCVISAIALPLLLLVCIVAAAVGFLLWQSPSSQLLVLINSPRSGERVGVGDDMLIHAVARGDQKIKRIELWVDGKLYQAQNSPIAGGVSPFPVAVNWHPDAPGAHAIVLRAFNIQNQRANAAISVEAVQNADRDGDGVLDALDRCADQPGPASNSGCPAVTTNDRDGDGIVDGIDACPEQAGPLGAQGCPDIDGDTVPDGTDACPREAGSAERNGCPMPGDTDGDGVPDASDRCAGEPGFAALSGCIEEPGESLSDRDGDGVVDVRDLCPDVAGPVSNSGCPPTGAGDRDGDGIDDSTDLAPSEPGTADSGGAPPPGGAADTDGDDIAEDEDAPGSADDVIPDGGSWEALNLVRIDALEFSVTQDYDHVYCYVTGGDAAERYGPFDLIGTRQWDIAEYLGGGNSRTIAVPVGRALDLHVECAGHYPEDGLISIAPADLGSITRSYPENQWDGHVITERSGMAASERGTAGHSFEVKFRLCYRSCETSEFPPPVLHNQQIRIGPLPPRPYLAWTWSGNENDITGYRLYINGNRHASIDASGNNRVRLDLYDPPCGETYQYHVTAYRANADGFNARESPASNTITVAGETCPRRVKVRFTYMSVAPYLPDDYSCCKGPYYGQFYAVGTEMRSLDWRGGECKGFLWIYACKTGWDYMWSANTAQIFAGINESAGDPALGAWAMYAPETDYVIVRVGEHDDLSIGAIIMDDDAYGGDDTRMNAYRTIPAGSILPTDLELRSGGNSVQVKLEELTGD